MLSLRLDYDIGSRSSGSADDHPAEATHHESGSPVGSIEQEYTDSEAEDRLFNTENEELLFACLERRWLSQRFGLLQVVREHVGHSRMSVLRAADLQEIGKILQGSERQWELLIFDGEMLCDVANPQILYFDGFEGTARRLNWANDVFNDLWDGRLLDAMFRAARSVEQDGLVSEADTGLWRLAEGGTTQQEVSVALCIATRMELPQLKRALPLNILHLWPHRNWTKIHLVVCNSADDTVKFLVEHCRFAIDMGLLEVYDTESNMPYWHPAIGKNTAHSVAAQKVLVTVDANMFVGPDFPCDILTRMLKGCTVLDYSQEGSRGPLAFSHEDFGRVRGYDEDSFPFGGHDVDLVHRLLTVPGSIYRRIRGSCHGQAISRPLHADLRHVDPMWRIAEPTAMEAINRSTFQERRRRGHRRRNLGKDYVGVPVVHLPKEADLPQDPGAFERGGQHTFHRRSDRERQGNAQEETPED